MRSRTRLATSVIATAAAALVAATLPATATARPAPDRAEAVRSADAALAAHADQLAVTAGQETSVRDVVIDSDGSRHVRYDRTFSGIPVLGGDLVVHLSPNGSYRGASRATRSNLAVPTVKPLISATKAAGLGTAALRDANSGTALSKIAAKPLLVIDALHGAPQLAWRTTAAGKDDRGNPAAHVVLTNARTGKAIDSWDRLETATGDGKSLYGGTVPLETTQSGSTYQLKDATRGGTYTGDAQNKTDSCILGICWGRAPAALFTDADNHWGSGTTTDRASAAVDAQYGTDTTWDYFKNAHGRNGIAGDGKGSYNRVHYGSGYNNAFWDDSCFCMTYGDGDGKVFGPLVSLDVAGHEMSHGVTAATANLTYSGESGGLNEATSDIFGTFVEFSAKNANDPGDYLIGEKIVRPDFGQAALRYMDKPSKDTKSADCWNSKVKDLDVHYSSGVANHFAYLLAEGSGQKVIGGVTHNSPTCNSSTVQGIGKDKVGKIWYRALTVYMTSGTNYAAARTATLNAAKDLYGADSAEQNAVAAAWSAVSVG
ncbi:M4 family metallopeptidase [Streptomyces purpurogeneiscleroticus]|uniref:M4 family metallopeptidase n=1 Tax=Streptomyces purpurogeneiscleroticus TaxID=68259 RepID=UPI001CBE9FC8|nr:M4 family metallopeptidase [Streptomyces purpurogeneiscleroticus]MBZ4018803.1 peptidase M4 family protein [Streptomyces purpurogeneiscleroticus]